MIRRTVIGSLPRLGDKLDSSIERAVKLQLKYRINPISDGEQRYDMIRYFDQIPGITEESGKMYIKGPIKPMKNPSESYKVKEYNTARRVLKRLGENQIEVKSSITGPITLGFTCATSKIAHYQSLLDNQLYLDLADALSPILSELLRLGAWVQIDEPGISAGYARPSHVEDVLNYMITRVEEESQEKDRLSIHVCGNLTKIPDLLNTLLNVKAGVLSVAFNGKGETDNISLLSKDRFEAKNKRLGVGCVSVNAREVTEVQDEFHIKARIKKIIEIMGRRNIAFLHPDCGLKNNPLKVTERILHAMMVSTDEFLAGQ